MRIIYHFTYLTFKFWPTKIFSTSTPRTLVQEQTFLVAACFFFFNNIYVLCFHYLWWVLIFKFLVPNIYLYLISFLYLSIESIYLSLCISDHLINLSLNLYIHLSTYLSFYLYICLANYLSPCICIYQFRVIFLKKESNLEVPLQTHHVYSTLKRRTNGRCHVVSTWNTCVFRASYPFFFFRLPFQKLPSSISNIHCSYKMPTGAMTRCRYFPCQNLCCCFSIQYYKSFSIYHEETNLKANHGSTA